MKTSEHRFQIIRPGDAPGAWDAFVDAHPLGSVFHSAGMCRAFDQARRYRSLAIAAQDAAGKIQALIAPVRVDAVSGFTRALTSRAVMFAEPLCSAEPVGAAAAERLLSRHDATVGTSTLFTEVRSLQAAVGDCPTLAAAGYQPRPFLNYVIDLSLSKQQLWRNIGKPMRGSIRSSLKRGVKIEVGNSLELQRRAYAQIRQSLRRAMVPCPSSGLFAAVQQELGTVLQVRVASYQGRDVAGTISLAWGDRYFAWYGGTSRPRSLHPFACLVWDEIQWAHDHGFRHYDFGGAGDPNRSYGPREFKSRFHGELIEIGRCRKVYSPRLLAIAERGYRSLKTIAGST
ncbi:FemAB family protein [Rosistilla carotiformis]|uniref:FemAB family protein n=1 Tax=Rosistilla carotiformis TaxID=2528017 RepID=A0A518JTE1_9BACT|nr:GNAT family N-acetyltransferase [Rosistilla carotiformis]QDV68812.1 FemAB family protein [Rosistilla carotiformis]